MIHTDGSISNSLIWNLFLKLSETHVIFQNSIYIMITSDSEGISIYSHPDQWRVQDFPEVGAVNPPGGMPTYNFAKFSPKLHGIEKIWTHWGVPRSPLRAATADTYSATSLILYLSSLSRFRLVCHIYS